MLTFQSAKVAFPQFNVGASVGDQINLVIEEAFNSGLWKGTVEAVRVAIYPFTDAGQTRYQLTLPRDAETALGIRFEGTNGVGHTCSRPIHNQWYSWTQGLCWGDWSSGLVDQGDGWATFRDIPVDAKLRIRTDFVESGTMYIRGTNSSGDTIYTGAPPNVIEGTTLNLASNPATTNETFKAFSAIEVVKPVTQGSVRLYSYDGTTETLLARYEPGETVPSYRRYQTPTVDSYTYALVKASRRFVPLVADNDQLEVMGLAALKLGLHAQRYETTHDLERAGIYWNRFYQVLNDALRKNQGNAPIVMKLRQGEGYNICQTM